MRRPDEHGESPLKLFTTPDGARRSNPLPSGTAPVAVGLVVAGLTAYAFLIVADRALGKTATAPLAAIWGVTFTAAPGFFLPLEQEVSRAVAGRRAKGVGAGPLIRRASLLGLGLLAFLLVSCSVAAPFITNQLFDGQWLLFVALLVGVTGYCAGHIARGVLSGRGRFGPYALYIGGEATFRLLICVALAVAGAKTAGGYGLAIGVAPILAVALIAGRALPDLH